MRSRLGFVITLTLAACPEPQGFFADDVPRPASGDEPCSPGAPTGLCDDGQTCRAGQCLEDALFCSAANLSGVCPSEGDACLDGSCVPSADLCSNANISGLCGSGLTCHDGVCATNEPCAVAEPLGFCAAGLACLDGTCVDREVLCSTDNTTGLCRTDTTCVDGTCIGDANLCSAAQPAGLCAPGKSCVGGACYTPAELCSATNTTGACDIGLACLDGQCVEASQVCGCVDGQTCVDGVCRDPSQLCSSTSPNGVCANGQSCLAGTCEDLGAGCSPQNQTGVCPPGQLCDGGVCAAVDGAALCDDNNECTTDAFDPVRNRCRNDARAGACDDGNACTEDTCSSDGACSGTSIAACIEPPVVDALASPTNVGSLLLAGSKPSGASVEVNGLEAVPENPDDRWSVTINLVPGDNVFVIRSFDAGSPSATREIHVVYDITAPVTRTTPEGGSFLTGITATIASDEPATVWFTTDGSEPTETSTSFTSLKQLRVFGDTHLRLRARDVAGNLAEGIVDIHFEISGRNTTWATGPTLVEGLSLAGAATTGDDVFIVGGTDGLAPQAGAFVYSIGADAFTTLPSLSGARDSLSVVAVGTTVYAIGGQNAGTPLNRVEELSAGGASWNVRQPMPTTRHSFGASAFNGRIYAFGGKSNGGAVLSVVEVYDPSGNSWSNAVAQMPRARAAFGVAGIDGKVYLVGGEDGAGDPIAELDVYDVGADSWDTLAPMPTPRSFLGVTTVLNEGNIKSGPKGIVASGGFSVAGASSAVVEEYLIEDDAWRERTPMPAARHSAAAVAVTVVGDTDVSESQGWLIGGQEGASIVATTRAVRSDRDYARRLPELPAPRFLHAAAALDDRIYIFGGRNFSEETEGWAFDAETGAYEDLPPLPTVQNGLAAAAVGDRVYAIGGANGFAVAVPTTRAFDPATREWIELQPMTSARRDIASAVHGTDVYVIGGDNGGALPTVEIYDTVDDQWRAGPLLPGPRTGASAVAHDGQIFVVGGVDASGTTVGSIVRLDGASWTTILGSIPVSFAHAFALQGRIAVFPGRVNGSISSGIFDYDVAAQRVEPGRSAADMLTPAVDRFAATLHNGRIFLFGGNENDAIGPQGTARVSEIDARCFNGVVDGREVAGGATGVDDGGGCPTSGFLHHTGVSGATFTNTRASDINALQGAIDACNAHHASTTCSSACSNCTSVTLGGVCDCTRAFVWHFGSAGCFGGDFAGQVTTFCDGSTIGTWD